MGTKADVIMLSSGRGQPFSKRQSLENLAGCINPGGLIFELNPDYPLEEYQPEMHEFFEPIATKYEFYSLWVRR